MVSQPSCWRLSPRISSSRLATSSPRPGWANNSLVTRVLIGAFLSYWGLSVAGGGVTDDDEGDDLAVADSEVVGQDELVRQVRLVVVAVVAAADDGVAVVVEHLGHLDPDPVADHLPGHPGADGLAAPELPVRVVDQGVVGGDVLGHRGGENGGVGHMGLLVRACPSSDSSTLGAPVAGGSSAHRAIDPPVAGGLTMAWWQQGLRWATSPARLTSASRRCVTITRWGCSSRPRSTRTRATATTRPGRSRSRRSSGA